MADPFADRPLVLSERQRDAAQAWVDQVRTRLALSDWRVRVSRHAATSDSFASSWIRDHADELVIALGAEFSTRSPDELRQDLTHELLHPHFQRVTRMAMTLIENELGNRTEAVIEAAVQEVEEQTIDRLAGAIARFLPLVELPHEEETHG